MAVKKLEKSHPFQKDTYQVDAIVAGSKVSKTGVEVFEPVRTFEYAPGKVAINVSIIETTDEVVSYHDVVCWSHLEFPMVKKLKLKEGDRVSIKIRPSKKADGSWGMIFSSASDVRKVEAI